MNSLFLYTKSFAVLPYDALQFFDAVDDGIAGKLRMGAVAPSDGQRVDTAVFRLRISEDRRERYLSGSIEDKVARKEARATVAKKSVKKVAKKVATKKTSKSVKKSK